MMDITNALTSLKPNAQWVLRGDELEWLDTEQTEPTDIEIQTELARLLRVLIHTNRNVSTYLSLNNWTS
jgi:hypothetical protein